MTGAVQVSILPTLSRSQIEARRLHGRSVHRQVSPSIPADRFSSQLVRWLRQSAFLAAGGDSQPTGLLARPPILLPPSSHPINRQIGVHRTRPTCSEPASRYCHKTDCYGKQTLTPRSYRYQVKGRDAPWIGSWKLLQSSRLLSRLGACLPKRM